MTVYVCSQGIQLRTENVPKYTCISFYPISIPYCVDVYWFWPFVTTNTVRIYNFNIKFKGLITLAFGNAWFMPRKYSSCETSRCKPASLADHSQNVDYKRWTLEHWNRKRYQMHHNGYNCQVPLSEYCTRRHYTIWPPWTSHMESVLVIFFKFTLSIL